MNKPKEANKMNIDFKKTVNTKKVNKLSLAQLTALNNLLDGKATKKDYKILKNANTKELNKKLKREKRLRAFKQAIKDSSKFKFDELVDRWQFIEQRTDELLGEYKWK